MEDNSTISRAGIVMYLHERMTRRIPIIAGLMFFLPSLFAFGELTVLTGLASFVIAWLGGRMILFFNMMRLQHKFYGNDIEAMMEDLTELEVEQDEANDKLGVTIVDLPKEFKTKFRDAPVYDWLMIKMPDDSVRKVVYDGITNYSLGDPRLKLQSNQIAFEPGIIYRLESDDDSLHSEPD